jgi:hypothetical protein
MFAPISWLPRRRVHEVRKKISNDPTNKACLDIYDGALFTVSLDDTSNPSSVTEVGQMTQFGCIKENGRIVAENLNTVTEAGVTFTVFANGAAGARAEHLISDGNIFSRVVNDINFNANKELAENREPDISTQNRATIVPLHWNIPEKYITEAQEYLAQQMKNRDSKILFAEGIGADELGKGNIDPCIQIAMQCALAEVRMQIAKGKKQDIEISQAVDFHAAEPTRARMFTNGRLHIANTTTQPVRDYMELALRNDVQDPLILKKAISAIKMEIAKAVQGEALLSQLMGLTAVTFRENPANAALYLQKTEDLCASIHPAIAALLKPEILGSNGGRADQAYATTAFCTVDPLAKEGMSLGYMPGANGKPSSFFIRAKGEHSKHCDLMGERIEYHLQRMRELLNSAD